MLCGDKFGEGAKELVEGGIDVGFDVDEVDSCFQHTRGSCGCSGRS